MAENYVGTLPGDFSVDSNGGASYSIPLVVPPGIGQVEPGLHVGYNSGGGNDLLGTGWSLQGLSLISRVGATRAQDGFTGAVNYDDNDRYTLDGQRLVPVSGNYGDQDAIYHTEIESWKKVVPVYNQNESGRNGPDSFLVYNKSGVLLEYGTTADSQVAASPANPSIRVWALNKITDFNGNYLTITYQQDQPNGAYYPLRIDYTGNGAISPQCSVQFSYETRPDVVPHYLGGYPVVATQRLSGVDSYMGGNLVLSYRFAYEQGTATGRSRLISITQQDAAGVSLTPTIFSYQDGDPAIFAAASTLAPPDLSYGGTMLPMDVNGDGLVDVVVAYPDPSGNRNLNLALLLAKPDGSGFADKIVLRPTGLQFGGQLLPMDVNGDGCMDLVYAVNDGNKLGLTVLLATEDDDSWTLQPGPINGGFAGTLPWTSQLYAMDVNGDGLTDLVHAGQTNNQLTLNVLFSNGTSFGSPLPCTVNNLRGGGQCIPLDFNGDGMTDLVYAYANNNYLDMALFLSAGPLGLVQQSGSPLPGSASLKYGGSLMPCDVNADGKGDLVYAVQNNNQLQLNTLLSNGVSFEPPLTRQTEVPYILQPGKTPLLLPMDVNGDGLVDLVVATSTSNRISLTVMLSTGSDFVAQTGTAQPLAGMSLGGQMLPLDMIGHGKTDLLYATSDNNQMTLTRTLAAGAFPDLLTVITNGQGGQIQVRYKPLTDPSVYAKAQAGSNVVGAEALMSNQVTGSMFPLPATNGLGTSTPGSAFATRTVDFPKYVVSGYLKSDGQGNQYDYGYLDEEHARFYVGAKLDLTGRGWLGFASLTTCDNNLQTTTLSEYSQEFPLTYSVKTTTTSRSTDNALMHSTVMQYATPSTSNASYAVQLTQVETQLFTFAQPNSAPDVVQTKTVVFDEFGNATSSSHISTEPGAVHLYTFDSYQNDVGNWRLGYKTESKRTADQQGNQVISWERMEYDPTTLTQTAHHVWHDQSNQWLTATYTHDQFGNPTSSTDPSGATSQTVYHNTYHSFVAQRISPPNQAGEHIVVDYDYYYGFSVLKSRSCPYLQSGSATQLELQQNIDGLGRVVETLGPDPTGNMVTLTTTAWASDEGGFYQQTQQAVAWDSSAWNWRKTYIDGLGRTYRTEMLGPDGATPVIIDRKLDSKGNSVQESLPYYQGTAPVTVLRSYDNYNRMTQQVTPSDGGSTTTKWTYDSAFQATQVEAYGAAEARQTVLQYATFNGHRQVVQRTDTGGGVTTYAYNAVGNVVAMVDPAGVNNAITYDSLSRQIEVLVSRGNTQYQGMRLVYDDANRVLTFTDLAGNINTTTFDALRRPLSKASGDETANLQYDLPSNSGSVDRLSRVDMSGGAAYDYSYDYYGRWSTVTATLGGENYTFQRAHTPTGKLSSMTYPDGFEVQNLYNAGNKLVSVGPSGGQALAEFSEFTPFGSASGVTYGNGVTGGYVYNDSGQLKHQTVTNTSGTALLDTGFAWNALFNLVSVTNALDSTKNQSFSYDGVGRLTNAQGDYASPQVFEYDLAGNLTLKDGITYTYNGNQMVSGVLNGEEVFSATYNAKGDMTAATKKGVTAEYTYDQERRLVAAGDTTFTYDYKGRRLIKQIKGGPTTYYVSPYYEVTVFADGSRQHTTYMQGEYGTFAAITVADTGNPPGPGDNNAGIPVPGTAYFHKNQINSTTVQTDEKGHVVTTIEYMPFGEINSISGADVARYKFTGQELDATTGLYAFRARYYDPSIARFISADDQPGGSLFRPDSLNRYAYVLNNPVTHNDPTGHAVPQRDNDSFFFHPWSFITHKLSKFSSAIEHFFTNKITETVLSYELDGLMIIVGTILVFAPGPGSQVFGWTLMGAGISGLTYNLTHQDWHTGTVSGDWSWKAYAANVGIGAATGLISGGIAVGFSELVDAGAAAGYATFEVGGAGRVAVNVTANVIGNSGADVVGQVFTNLMNHDPVTSGLGWNALIGGLAGLGGSVLSEAAAFKMSRQVEEGAAFEMRALRGESGFHYESIPDPDELLSNPEGRMHQVMPDGFRTNFILTLPYVLFTGYCSGWTGGYSPGW